MRYTQFNPRPYEAHRIVYDLVEPYSKVLDLGCATGYFGCALNKKHCIVFGIDSDKEAVRAARYWYKRVILGDLENPYSLSIERQNFDFILCMDVIEHLVNRENFLTWTRRLLKSKGKFIISTPNIAHISIRLGLFLGDFTYGEFGIMDKTHVHFFTKKSLCALIYKCGYKIDQFRVSADLGQLPLVGRFLRHLPKTWQSIITNLFPTVLGVQFIAVCKVQR